MNSNELLELLKKRRSYRKFSGDEISEEDIINCIKIAGLAPSGANMQPWTYVIVKDKELRKRIREEAELIEKDFYLNHIPDEWRDKLAPLKTDFSKPFLEEAPYLIVIFAQSYGISENGKKIKHYYVKESVNISIGFLIYSLHLCGLASLTYTPTRTEFLSKLLDRPENEKPVFMIPVGYPSADYELPKISKKDESDFIKII